MKNNNDLHYQSTTELVAALANKEISSLELVEKTISRIELLDQKINAIVVRDFEQARKLAKAADKAIAQNKRLPLLGLPITVKECFNITGLPTTWGNSAFKNWYPSDDALAITRLKNAGAIIIGKTNVPFMLGDWQTYNELYGTTNNPWDLRLTPGGSSGGSAAALAAGFTSLELGSDLAGSIRVPVSYCGIFGHKPSIDLIPTRGANPPTTPLSPNPLVDLAVVGPMARTATDLALALDVLAGPDELWNGKGYKLSLPPPRHNDLRSYRVLVIDTHPLCQTASIISESINHLVERLTKLGVSISNDIQHISNLAEITQNFITLFAAFIGSRVPNEQYKNILEASAKMLNPNDKSALAYYLRGCTLTHRDWFLAMSIRDKLRQQFRNLFKEFDVILCPVMPTPAFFHDHSDPFKRQIEIDGTLFPYSDQYAWVSIASLFGLPATVAPIDYTESGLPIGIQIMGDYCEDYTTIKFANLLEDEFGGFSVSPLLRASLEI